MFFSSWYDIWRIVVMSTLAYFVLILVLRITGKRALSKLSAYDFVVTVALGSAMASIIVNKNVTLAEGLTAFAMLCGLQFIMSWLFIRFPKVEGIVKAQPSLVMYSGDLCEQVMRKVRVTKDDVTSAIRSQGMYWEQVQAVILETDGSLTVLPKSDEQIEMTFEQVRPQPPGCRKEQSDER